MENGEFGDFTEVGLPSDLLNVRTSWEKTLNLTFSSGSDNNRSAVDALDR